LSIKKNKNYGFLFTLVFEVVLMVVVLITVSFFRVSGIIEVSFFVVSFVVMVDESLVVVSELAEPLPLQATIDAAIATAKKPSLNEFFIGEFYKLLMLVK
jgi:hypothetical protein